MTDYFSKLEDDDKRYLVNKIPWDSWKHYFSKYPTSFNALQKGFRASALTQKQVEDLVWKNRADDFIVSFFNNNIDQWLKDIHDIIYGYEQKGVDQQTAHIDTLSDSYFSERPELYYRIVEKPDGLNIGAVCEGVLIISAYRINQSKFTGKTSENQPVQSSLEGADDIIRLREDCEEKATAIENLSKENDSLKAENAALKKRTNKAADNEAVIEEKKRQYDDSIELELLQTDKKHISICEVLGNEYDNNMMTRLYDVSKDGRLIPMEIDESQPLHYYDNRDRLYRKDGPDSAGDVGIWAWVSVPNENDSTKDYVIASYIFGASAIEFVELAEASTIVDVVDALHKGLTEIPKSDKFLVGTKGQGGMYSAVLCQINNFIQKDNKLIIKPSVVDLPGYSVSAYDFIQMDNHRRYYKKIVLGIPQTIVKIRSVNQIALEQIISHFSWNALKQRDVSRTEWQKMKEFLSSMGTEDFITQIAMAAECSEDEAQVAFHSIIDSAKGFFEGTSIEDEVILSVIHLHPELLAEQKESIREEVASSWKKENEQVLAEAAKEIQISQQKTMEAKEEEKELRTTIDNLRNEIKKQQELAATVEAEAKKRIEEAQKNISKFLVDQMFYQPQISATALTTAVESTCSTVAPMLREGDQLDLQEAEESQNWKDVYQTLCVELEPAGTSRKRNDSLAALLCACLYLKYPILVVGPNGFDLADAISVSFCARYADHIGWRDQFDDQCVRECLAENGRVICIENGFSNGAVNRLGELSASTNFYCLLHPYVDDLFVAPQSIYDYCIPIITESVLDHKASRDFVGGFIGQNFDKQLELEQGRGILDKQIREIDINLFAKSRMQNILQVMRALSGNNLSQEDMVREVLYPYAYLTMQKETLIDALRKDEHLAKLADELC